MLDRAFGVGDRVHSLTDLVRSVAGAQLALLTNTVSAADLDPAARLLVTAAAAGTLPEIRAALDPLRAKPHLLDAVTTWLAAGCDTGAAAARLHVHRNSLRYRLTRAEHLTGLSFATAHGTASLHLALLADRLHDRLYD